MAKDTASETNTGGSLLKRKGIVRPEAQPLKWDELTRDQRDIIKGVHDWLVEFVAGHHAEPQPTRWQSPFDYQKPFEKHLSNILLLDGGRGSGKTSLLVTLLDLWRKKAGGEPLVEFPRNPGAQEIADPKALELHQDIISALNGPLAGRLVPVRTLDLQPLPRSTSLLSWVASRILELVNHLEHSSGSPGERPHAEPIASWQPDWQKELPSRLAWRKVMRCAALGWDSNLPQRQGNLDPDSYTEELKDAERARLSMVDVWREFVATVVQDVNHLHPKLARKDACLIVPIDDADMNPERCEELLELMRSLWSPQLVFVLTGDSKLFVKMLHVHHLGVLHQKFGSPTVQPEEFRYLEAAPSPRNLALQVYDKIVPPSHRFALPALEGNERLSLLRDVMGVKLVKYPNEKKLPPWTLDGYFDWSPRLQIGLPHRLRRLLNIQSQLAGHKRAGELVQRLWNDAIDNGEWTQEQQLILKGLVQLDSHKELRVILRERFKPQAEGLLSLSRYDPRIQVRLSLVTGYTLVVPQLGEKTTLPEYLTSLLLLACNVAADEKGGYFPALIPAPHNIDYPLVAVRINMPSRPSTQLSFHWPIPQWQAPSDFIAFDRDWTERLMRFKDEGATFDGFQQMVYLFLSGIHGIGMNRRVSPDEDKDSKNWQLWVHRLVDTLQAKYVENPEINTPREKRFREWLLGESWLIAAPEYGLPTSLANEILAEWQQAVKQLPELAEEMQAAARQARQDRANFALKRAKDKENAENLLRDIDNAHPDHQWAYLIEGRSKPALELTPRIQNHLERIAVQHAPDSTTRAPRNLREYITRLDVMPLLSTSDKQRLTKLERQLGKYVSAQGSAPQAIRDLWRYVLAEESRQLHKELEQLISVSGTTMKVHLPDALEQRLLHSTASRGDAEAEYRFGRWRGLRIYQVEEWLESPSHAIQGLLKVAHDVNVDVHDTTLQYKHREESPLDGALPSIATLILDQIGTLEVDWPVPHWNTFLDWKLTAEVWNTTYRGLLPLLKDDEGLIRSALVSIAHSLLRGMTNIWAERSVPEPYIDLQLTPKHLGSEARTLLSSSDPRNREGLRHKRFVEWVEGPAVLLGAPETGLPGTVVEDFLVTLLEKIPQRPIRQDVEASRTKYIDYVRELRRERIRRALKRAQVATDDSTVSQVLARIDGMKDTHPWLRLFGADTSGPKRPTKPRRRKA